MLDSKFISRLRIFFQSRSSTASIKERRRTSVCWWFFIPLLLGFDCYMPEPIRMALPDSSSRRTTRRSYYSEERSSRNAINAENSSSSAEDVRRNRPNVRRYVRTTTEKRDWTIGDIHQRFVRAVDQLGGQDSKWICTYFLEFVNSSIPLLERENWIPWLARGFFSMLRGKLIVNWFHWIIDCHVLLWRLVSQGRHRRRYYSLWDLGRKVSPLDKWKAIFRYVAHSFQPFPKLMTSVLCIVKSNGRFS